MECPKCKNLNPETNKFCGHCGAPLDITMCAIDDYVCRQVESTLQTLTKDRDLVQVEIAESISKKLMNWAKIFAFFVGIPIGLLTITLSVLGIKSITELQTSSSLIKETNKLAQELIDLKAKADLVKPLEAQINELQSRMIYYETPIEQNLSSKLNGFIDFWKGLGYDPKPGTRVKVDSKLIDETRYNSKENRIYLGELIQNDEQLLLREYAMHVLSTSLARANVDRDHVDAHVRAIESGLEDYYTCSYTNNPKLGEPTVEIFRKLYGKQFYKENNLRDLENTYKFGDIPYADDHQNGGIWAAAFWEIRKSSGKEYSDKLLFNTWNKYIKIIKAIDSPGYFPTNSHVIFVDKLLEVDRQISKGEYNNQIKAIFSRRGINNPKK